MHKYQKYLSKRTITFHSEEIQVTFELFSVFSGGFDIHIFQTADVIVTLCLLKSCTLENVFCGRH